MRLRRGFTIQSMQFFAALSIKIYKNTTYSANYYLFSILPLLSYFKINKCLMIAHFQLVSVQKIKMYNQKFAPYGGFPARANQLYEEEEYQEEESQPLVEEVDESYEPTDREVREYAIETLGMRLPEDEGLLYLAREGLKAPLPDNWVPYQGRDGEVYYKHRITQEKTYDHPTDLQYRKKYEQQKEKMARKNLKSMNMKASNQFQATPSSNLNPNASNIFAPSKLSNSGLIPNPSEQSSIKLDPRIEKEYEEELENLEERLRREWKDYELEQRQRSETRIKKLKQEYENEISKLYSGKQKEVRIEDKLREERERIKEKLDQQLQEALREELKDYEKDLQNKNKDFHSVYEQDMHFKINKYQQEKDAQFDQRQAKQLEMAERLARERENRKKEIQETLRTLRGQFENGQNREIEAATADALHQELQAIQASYAQKLRQREEELEREYLETKRVLGFDQNTYLSELASKKSRIKAISKQKIESFKKREMQAFTLSSQNQLQQAQREIIEALAREHAINLQQERIRQEQRLAREKERLDKESKARTEAQIQNIYDEMKAKVRAYEAEMNRKLSSVQEKFIDDIHGKSRGQSKDITFRLEAKEKEMAVQNKTMLIASLKRQIELETVTLSLMRVQNELYQCKDHHQLDERLLKLAKQHGLDYRSDKYIQFEAQYREMKERCRRDKEFLASVMGSLQSHKGHHPVGGQAILKQYNQDVRLMRENEDMLRKMEGLLKRAEVNDRAALDELARGEMQYQEIQLKREMGRISSSSAPMLQEMQEEHPPRVQQPFTRAKDIESALKDHSRFLSSMRNELNRKLYQIRSGTHY